MGDTQITLKNKGYTIKRKIEDGVVATKDEDKFFIRWFKISTNEELVSRMEILKETSHCHIVNTQNSFTDQDMYYVVMEDCQGGTLAEKIRGMSKPLQESEALSLIVELCLALKTIQDKGLLHKHLTPQGVFLSEFGTLRLGGFGKIQENAMTDNATTPEGLNYVSPETLTRAKYDTKSVIWSVGCILYELCTQQQAFSADTRDNLISRITSGPDPVPQGQFSSEFVELLSDMLSKNPDLRPTVQEMLKRPIVLRCLLTKCKSTTEHLQDQLNKLKCVADDLERIHRGTTIGSLTGGVIGAVGGITSIVGIALAPFTLGASLVVAGIGAGVGLAGGLTAGASNIVKAINESSDRKAFKRIVKEFDEKINTLTLWLHEIDNSLQTIRQRASHNIEDKDVDSEEWAKVGTRALRNLSEVGQLARVAAPGKIIAQIPRAARVVGAAGAVFSALFVAADVFFIAMDAKEIHNINQTGADGKTRSEVMKFVESIRTAAGELQQILDEFKSIIVCIDSFEDDTELQWQHME
ncbi:uncharacterized protein V6R79_026336 [Siganus canaliculatus]